MDPSNTKTETAEDTKPTCYTQKKECCGCVRLFRACRVALAPGKLFPAFCGIVATILAGYALDAIWLSNQQPAVAGSGEQGFNELTYYLGIGGGAAEATRSWIEGLGEPGDIQRVGVFELLLLHARGTANQISESVLRADVGGILGGFKAGVGGIAWLVSMHPGYAILFFLIGIAIWAFFGGAISRSAILDIAQGDQITLGEGFAFARKHFTKFATAPIIPIAVALIFAAMLWIGGAVGAIPAVGELFVGLFFILALIAGLIIALVMIIGVAGFPLMAPGVAADNLDAWDAVSAAGSYVFHRPWKLAFYGLISICYGGLCLVLLKLFVALALWCVGQCAGASMNWGDAYAYDAAGEKVPVASKLDAMWQAPTPTGNNPFYGTFGEGPLRGVSWFSQICLKIWIFAVWGLVAAFVASFYYSSSGIIYLLLRREVDLTDFEDVYLEEADKDVAIGEGPSESPAEEASDRTA